MLWRNKLPLLHCFNKNRGRLALYNHRPRAQTRLLGASWLVKAVPDFPILTDQLLPNLRRRMLPSSSCTCSPISALELPESKGGAVYYLTKCRQVYHSTHCSIAGELARSSSTLTTGCEMSRVRPFACMTIHFRYRSKLFLQRRFCSIFGRTCLCTSILLILNFDHK
jgi:hypothetical protein